MNDNICNPGEGISRAKVIYTPDFIAGHFTQIKEAAIWTVTPADTCAGKQISIIRY